MASRATRVVSPDQLRALLWRAPCGIRASSTFAPNRLPPPPDPEIYAPEEAEAFKMKVHGTTLKDDLKWLEDPSHFETMMYMRAENRYWQMISRELRTDIDTFKREMAAAVPSADVPLPSTQAAGYSYFMHTDRPLPVYTRMRAGEEHEEVLIDQNRLATQYRFTQIGDVKASPNGRYVAFLMDTRGDESYSLYLIDCAQPYHERDEKGGRIVALHVTSFDWLGNDRLVFAQTTGESRDSTSSSSNNSDVNEENHETEEGAHQSLRPNVARIRRILPEEEEAGGESKHSHGDSGTKEGDVLLFEDNPHAWIDVKATKDQKYVLVTSISFTTTQVFLVLPTGKRRSGGGGGGFECVPLRERKEGIIDFAEHANGYLYISTNEGNGLDFGIIRAHLPPHVSMPGDEEEEQHPISPAASSSSSSSSSSSLSSASSIARTQGACTSRPPLPLDLSWKPLRFPGGNLKRAGKGEGPYETVFLEEMDLFESHLVLYERVGGGCHQVRVVSLSALCSNDGDRSAITCEKVDLVPLPSRYGSVTPGINKDFSANSVRFSWGCSVSPSVELEYEFGTMRLYQHTHQRKRHCIHDPAAAATAAASSSLSSSPPSSLSHGGTHSKLLPSLDSVAAAMDWGPLVQEFKEGVEDNCREGAEARSIGGHDVLTSIVAPRGVDAEMREEGLSTTMRLVQTRVRVQSNDAGSLDRNVQIPLTLLYASTIDGDRCELLGRHRPVLLRGYGAYGLSVDLEWNRTFFPLLRRGWVIASAHVRGGGELGRSWHKEGSTTAKENSFSDMIACGKFMLKDISHPDMLCLEGASAGGLLVGASINMQPSMFRAALIRYGFLDPLSSLLDEEAPLSRQEYLEWGDPVQHPEVFSQIAAYSPQQNLACGDTQQSSPSSYSFPWVLLSAGMEDPRVPYWQPLKYLAKLRRLDSGGGRNMQYGAGQSSFAASPPTNIFACRVDIGTGHFGRGGDSEALEDAASECAFLSASIASLKHS